MAIFTAIGKALWPRMLSPFHSPLITSTRISTPQAHNDRYRDSEDAEPQAGLEEFKLSVREPVSGDANEQGFLTGPTRLETLPAWRRGLATNSPFTTPGSNESDNVLPLLANSSRTPNYSRKRCRKPKLTRCVLFPLLGFFVML